METRFQTSFIPKKPLSAPAISPHRGGPSIFMSLAVLIFLASLLYAGFSIWWTFNLKSNQEAYKKQLETSKNQFNPQLIETLKNANTKLDLSKDLLKNHMAVSAIFDILSKLTIQNVRFNSFEFTSPATSKENVKITLRGVGTSFDAVAFQSDVFGQSAKYGKNKILKNPIVSDLAIDQNGGVGFTFTATLNPIDLSYSKVLDETLDSESALPPSSNTQ